MTPVASIDHVHVAAANAPLDPAWGQRLFAPEVLIAPGRLAELAAPATLIMGACDPIWPPDSLTGMEANLRFVGPETMESKIFARLTAWQNWIFQRPNAVGENGALRRYGSGQKPQFDMTRV